MEARAHGTLLRWLLLCALALGVVGMHHLGPVSTGVETVAVAQSAMDGHGAPAPIDHPSESDQPRDPHSDHGLLHLCLAVLGGVAALLIGTLLHTSRTRPHPPAMTIIACRPVPRRPLAGRHLLSTVCVLRL
ncbi:hypothetical protein [Actinokineospora sp.]|uniref:hypothetical protein n=1 Tax=Actinokineospora sp. TaxID=1872133 RepID=UPI004037C9A2